MGRTTCYVFQTIIILLVALFFLALGIFLIYLGMAIADPFLSAFIIAIGIAHIAVAIYILAHYLSMLPEICEKPSVSLICSDEFAIEQTGAYATIRAQPNDLVVHLNSSAPEKVRFSQASIVGSGNVGLIIGNVPSLNLGDIILTAQAHNNYGTAHSEERVTVIKLEKIEITYPNTNGTFTSLNNENQITIKGITIPAEYAQIIRWEVEDDPRDTLDSGTPTFIPHGETTFILVNPPTVTGGRRLPLSYRIKAILRINEFDQVITEYATQDEIDQCRQEYIDMPPNNDTPDRNEFVDVNTYTNPGHFPFDQINTGHHDVVLFLIGGNLENVRTALGNPMQVNSAYRNPIKNSDTHGSAENSYHIYGRAADIQVIDFNGDGVVNQNMVPDPTGQDPQVGDDWALLAAIAHNLGAVIEPWRLTRGTRVPPHGWVHMEWRP